MLARVLRCASGPWALLPVEWCAPRGLGGPRSRLDGRDGAGDGPIHIQEDLLAVMVHLQRRAVEQAVRRFRGCHLDAQAAATEHKVEGEPFQRVWQPRREPE